MLRYHQFLVDLSSKIHELAESNTDSILALLDEWSAESQLLKRQHEEKRWQHENRVTGIRWANLRIESIDAASQFWEKYGGKPANKIPEPDPPEELRLPYRTDPLPFNRVLSFFEKVACLVAIHDVADPTLPPISRFHAPETAIKMRESDEYIAICREFETIKYDIEEISEADNKIIQRMFDELVERLTGDDVEFAFRPNGDGYYINAFGQSGHVPIKGATGLHDIFRLIQSPNTPVEMLELQFGRPVELLPGEKRTEQQIADAETVKSLKAEKLRLRDEINSAKNDVERDDSQRRLDEVTAEGSKMFDHTGKLRNMKEPWAASRSAIRKRLNKAYSAIAIAGLPKLAENLKPIINAHRDSYIYRPGDDWPEWQFCQKKQK